MPIRFAVTLVMLADRCLAGRVPAGEYVAPVTLRAPAHFPAEGDDGQAIC